MDPNFFGLSKNPFAKSEGTDTACLTEDHLALTAELHAGLKAPHGITLLIGEQGAGKTTFIRNFLAQLPESFVVAYLPTAGPGLRHLLTETIEQLGGTVTAGGQEQALIDTLRALAKARAEHDRATLVVIDEAHELPAKTIERLGKLFGPDAAEPSRLHVTLVGRPELLDRMNAANDRSILKHLVQVCRMDAIGPEDAFRYIADRVQKVGGIVERLFSEDALRLIVQRANGNPARIGALCTAALESAAGRGVQSVDADAVEAAASSAGERVSPEGSRVTDEQPETPTYFFSEEDDEQLAGDNEGAAAPTAPRTLPREGAAVPLPASRRRLVFWAAGAIAVVIAFAALMTVEEFPLIGGQSTVGSEENVQTATAERTRRQGTKADQKAAPGADEPLAIPKLVVKRGEKLGDDATARAKEMATGRKAEGPDGAAAPATSQNAVAAAPPAVAAAQNAPEASVERPRFPAPPLPPAVELPVKQPTADPAPAAIAPESAFPTSVPRPAAAKPAVAPAAAVETPSKPQVPTSASAAAPGKEPASVAPAKTADAPIAPTRPAAAPAPTLAPPAPVQIAAPKAAAPIASSVGRYTVQLGAFSSRANAETLLARARTTASDGRIVTTNSGGKSVFRVVAGSFATQSEANAHANALKKSGYTTFVRTVD